MKITWYGHACFRLEADDGTSVVTDPFTPATSGLTPDVEPADFVIRSSPTDDFHCNAGLVPGNPRILEALEIADVGPTSVDGLRIEAFAAQESLIHKEIPADNAMYRIEMDNLSVLHLGDLGNPFDEDHIARLRGRTDVMLVLTGGPPTIDLGDLKRAIEAIGPSVVIPMHYQIPKLKLNILPVDAFTSLYPAKMVKYVHAPSVVLDRDRLPAETEIYVLNPAS